MTIIRVVDLETNGLKPPAEVLELATCDLDNADGPWTVGLPESRLFGCSDPLDPVARAAHHITPAELEGKPLFDPAKVKLTKGGAGAIVAHNWDFEAQWLSSARLPAICTYKASLRVWPEAPSHSNGALRYWLEDQGLIAPAHSITQPAHRAGPDAYVTAHILRALLQHTTGRQMAAWTKEPPLHTNWPLGKWRGFKLADIPTDYFEWVLRDKGMDENLKWNAQREINRRLETP